MVWNKWFIITIIFCSHVLSIWADPVVYDTTPNDTIIVTAAKTTPLATPLCSAIGCGTEPTRTPLFAFKTNLLFDAATLVNAGIEVPLGRHWSIEAAAYFPWWKSQKHNLTIQTLMGTLECKYWFGNRSKRPVMTGWFAGLYAGAGYYDFQLKSIDGVQGELFIIGGLSAGFAHTISKHLRLEYSLGFGYLRSDYRKYQAVSETEYGYIKVRRYPWENKRFSALFPTKASISLVWLLDKKKGGRR